MDAIYYLVRSTQFAPMRLCWSLLKNYWGTLLKWRQREKLRARLNDLSDRELRDIGITRGEVDYAASNGAADPRGIRTAEWVRYLPTVDGQVGHTVAGSKSSGQAPRDI
jgi:uncharacterized protein YjiS (DUF1127 family)